MDKHNKARQGKDKITRPVLLATMSKLMVRCENEWQVMLTQWVLLIGIPETQHVEHNRKRVIRSAGSNSVHLQIV